VSKRILITGASGLIGSQLQTTLTQQGYEIATLSRRDKNSPFYYDSAEKRVHLSEASPLYAVINLAGPSIADGRWSPARKREILESRRDLTQALSSALAAAEHKPELYLSASAVGFYGPSSQTENADGDDSSAFDESSKAGSDFLADVATQWEAATSAAREAQITTLHLRFGVVLSTHGGVLGKLLLPFKFCAGGRLGNGQQLMSWIALPDALQIISKLVERPSKAQSLQSEAGGALNLVTDYAVSNAQFTEALGKALKRPTPFPLPEALINVAFGEMGRTLLLGSSNVRSRKLDELGLRPKLQSIDDAVASLVEQRL
jgi:uncharacterized protein (TIGR01777 family)